jgi:hypothetical protein
MHYIYPEVIEWLRMQSDDRKMALYSGILIEGALTSNLPEGF